MIGRNRRTTRLSLLTFFVMSACVVGNAGCASSGSAKNGEGYDLQSVPFFKNCGKTERSYPVGRIINLDTCSWQVVEVETVAKTETGQAAVGKFVLIKLKMKNTGTSDAILTGIEAELGDAANTMRETDPSKMTPILSSMGRDYILQGRVKPGQTVIGWIGYDVAKDAKRLKLRVRDPDIGSSATAVIELGV